jgi:serine/threonine-protein kinase ATR
LKDEVDLRKLAKDALLPIQKKLQGIYTSGEGRDDWKEGKEMTTGNLVDTLIQEAKSNKNLVSGLKCELNNDLIWNFCVQGRMYPGWGPFL